MKMIKTGFYMRYNRHVIVLLMSDTLQFEYSDAPKFLTNERKVPKISFISIKIYLYYKSAI